MTDTTLNPGGGNSDQEYSASHWVKRSLAVMFGLGLVATLCVVFTRVIVARVPEQRATLEKLIAERTGLAVSFENVRFSWGLDGTGAVFTRVVLTDPKADRVRVVAPELRVELDTWDLLRHRQFSLGHVTLASPDIEIIGDAAGPAIQRSARPRDREPLRRDEAALIRSYLSWAELMPAGRIEVEGARVHLKRRGERVASHSFTLSDAVISRGSSSFNAHGTMLLSQDVGQSLFVSAKFEGLTTGARVSGDLRVIARRVFLERLPVAGLAGRGTIDAKLQIQDGLLASASWQLSARDMQLNGDGGTRFDHATVSGRMSRESQDLLLQFEDLQLTRGARLERAPMLSARMQIDSDSLQVTRTTVQAERLPFMATEFFAGLLAPQLETATLAATDVWTPTAGMLRDVRFDSGPRGRAAWTFSARVAGGALSRAADLAQLAQLQGAVRADPRGLTLAFDPGNSVALSMGAGLEPRTVTLGGELVLLANDSTPGWRFKSFTATQGASTVAADGAWQPGAKSAEALNLTLAQVDRAWLQDVWTLLAANAPPPGLFVDVQQATIVEGRLAMASAADGSVNWSRSSGQLALAEIATQLDATTRLTAGRGTLTFARGAAQLRLDAGSVDELELNSAQLDWPRRGAPRLRVALAGDLKSPLIRDALHAQGLDRLAGSVVLDAEARGEHELRHPELWRVTARLRDGRVPVGAGLPPAENLAGTLRYSARQLRGLELQGDWLGGPIEIEARRASARGPLSFTLHGVADAAPLLALSGKAEATQRVNGQLAWSGSAEPGAENGSWQITLASNLSGIESQLPEPFDKLRARAVPISAQLNVTADGIRDFTIESADDLSIHGQVRGGITTAKFTLRGVAGELRRAAQDAANPRLQIDTLDLKRAPAVLAVAGALLPADADLTLTVADLRNGSNSFGTLSAELERRESGLAFSVESSATAAHQLVARGECQANGRCDAEFSAATAQLAALLRDVRLPDEWPLASLHASGTLAWPVDAGADVVRSLTGSFDLSTEGVDREHQLAARGTIADGQILFADVQGTGPAPDQVFRGNGRIGLVVRDYDVTVDYERVALAAAAVPTPARARLTRAWNAVRGSVARRGWTEAPDSKRVQWHGTWD